MPTAEGRPKVFISYARENADTVRRVYALADYLDGNGVHLEMDRYLEPGANLYAFMESCVNDPRAFVIKT